MKVSNISLNSSGKKSIGTFNNFCACKRLEAFASYMFSIYPLICNV